jgi:NTP pyrophosphatase (non-canonical NTP hydrolase)
MALCKWTPTTDLLMLRRMGKTGEEAAELLAVTNRCIIQGIDEVDPGTGKVNRQRLEDEIADVQAQLGCTVMALGLDRIYIAQRTADKVRQMREWEAMFAPRTND